MTYTQLNYYNHILYSMYVTKITERFKIYSHINTACNKNKHDWFVQNFQLTCNNNVRIQHGL